MTETLYFAFLETTRRLPHHPALMYKAGKKFKAITYGELSYLIDKTAAGLKARGVKPEMRIGIYSYNRPEWSIADLATLKLGAIVVPIYHTLSVETVCYILNEAEVSYLFIENPELLRPLMPHLPELRHLQLIVTFFEQLSGDFNGKPFVSMAALQDEGERFLKKNSEEANPYPAQPDDVLTICYTSGTTGEPKGAMLSHRNILTNVRAAIERFRISERDRFVSFLPLCHMFERTCGYYTMLLAGATIAYSQSIQTIREDVAQIKPTVLLVVPRVLEKVYNAVQEKVLTGSALSRRLMIATLKTAGRSAVLRTQQKKIPIGMKLKKTILELLVIKKLRKLGGGKIRLIVSGGAPLERKLARTFRNLGFNLLEGYGLTETAPVVCAAAPGEERIGTVGKPFPGVEVKIGDNDEILVRGVNVMKGYFNKPQETARAIDAGGWFHTGDQGKFDAEGNLIITGRIKELIVNSYGKNIPPVPLELALSRSKYIEQAVVFGDKKPYLIALIVPARLTLADYARENKISFRQFEELLNYPAIIELFRTEIDRCTSHFSTYEQIRKFSLIPEPLTVENDLLTPTLKVRRNKTYEAYRELIESMYQKG
ncbi:MAG: AMP-dependent synthetase/ligase [bacterium]